MLGHDFNSWGKRGQCFTGRVLPCHSLAFLPCLREAALAAEQRRHARKDLVSAAGGELGWCLDMTSTHGAWRHAGVRFLLSGECICFDTTLWPALGLPSMAPMAGCGPPRTRPARPHADDAAGPVVSGTPCAKEARPPTLHGRGRGAGACFPLARIVATSRREGWSGRRAAPSSPALLAVSGPRGGAAKACRGRVWFPLPG